jgi:hypothetical protein
MRATPPRRLAVLADPSSALVQGLTAARLRGPSEDELRALERNLAAALGGAALMGAATGAATAKSGGGVAGVARTWLSTPAMKATTLVILAAVGTTAALAWRRYAPSREHAPAVARPDRAHAVSTVVPAPAAAGPQPMAPLPSLSSGAPPPAPPKLAETSPFIRRGGSVRSRHADTARSAVGGRPVAVATPPGDESGLRDELNLRDELQLIGRAQQVLPHDPGHALALTEEHERRYRVPLLAQEREVIAVAALSKLGRTSEARARAERFVQRFPDSAHVLGIRRLAAAAAGRTP